VQFPTGLLSPFCSADGSTGLTICSAKRGEGETVAASWQIGDAEFKPVQVRRQGLWLEATHGILLASAQGPKWPGHQQGKMAGLEKYLVEKFSMKLRLLFCGLLIFIMNAAAGETGQDDAALKDVLILIIRHAEKPDNGSDLSTAGEERAKAYVNYFKSFTVNSRPSAPDYLIVAADSKKSRRPRQTLEPLSQATGLAIDGRFSDKQFQELAEEIRTRPPGKHILICWHHGEIPQLVRALGADPAPLLPKSQWPAEVYGWIIQLRYDANGRLMEARRFNENLMPDDSAKPVLIAP
jgi:hypothetical protein